MLDTLTLQKGKKLPLNMILLELDKIIVFLEALNVILLAMNDNYFCNANLNISLFFV